MSALLPSFVVVVYSTVLPKYYDTRQAGREQINLHEFITAALGRWEHLVSRTACFTLGGKEPSARE
jgi:hypothetical protein